MANDVFDKIIDYLAKLPGQIEKGVAVVVIREVDRYALEFLKQVRQNTPYNRLKGGLKLERTFNRGKYGYKLLFDGTDENNTPLQLLANVANSGRKAGSGVAESGRRYAYGKLDDIQFITKHMQTLNQINKSIAKNLKIEEWIVRNNGLQINDGTFLSLSDLETYKNKESGG